MQRKLIVINGENFYDMESFYIEIDKVMTKDLTWKTGHNLDAFNDLLRGGFGMFEYLEPIELIWKNSEKSRKDLGFTETIKCYEASLRTCHPSNADGLKRDIENAKQGKGTTLFDLIIEIIEDHEHIELQLK